VARTTYFAARQPAPLRPGDGRAFNPFAYTFDLLLPIINLRQEDAFNPTGTGQAVAYILIIAGWVLATAVIAGITRVLSRT
jgi:hypothetical protein